MEIRTDCECFEAKPYEWSCGDCQTDGHYLCVGCRHIASFNDMELFDNRMRYYPEQEKSQIMLTKHERLQKGEIFITSEKGNSMVPLIMSGQKHELSPCTWQEAKEDDIVYCKVKGKFYTHIVKAKNDVRGCLIGNNKGGINGWTKQVFGRVTNIF